jgi:hypothetical protein
MWNIELTSSETMSTIAILARLSVIFCKLKKISLISSKIVRFTMKCAAHESYG